jgi:ABC-type branched-subunit amino acid transport system substrate-binding protein
MGMLLCGAEGRAAAPEATIAVQSSLTGSGAFSGKALVEAIRFAVETANATGNDPPFKLDIYDDGSTQAGPERQASRKEGQPSQRPDGDLQSRSCRHFPRPL